MAELSPWGEVLWHHAGAVIWGPWVLGSSLIAVFTLLLVFLIPFTSRNSGWPYHEERLNKRELSLSVEFWASIWCFFWGILVLNLWPKSSDLVFLCGQSALVIQYNWSCAIWKERSLPGNTRLVYFTQAVTLMGKDDLSTKDMFVQAIVCNW